MFKGDHGVTFWKSHNWWCQENRRNTSHLNCLSLSPCPPSPQSHGIAPALVWVRPLVGMGLVLFSEVNTYPRRMRYIWIMNNTFFKCKKRSHHVLETHISASLTICQSKSNHGNVFLLNSQHVWERGWLVFFKLIFFFI